MKGHILDELFRRARALDAGHYTVQDWRSLPPFAGRVLADVALDGWRKAYPEIVSLWRRQDRIQSQLHAPGYDPYNHQLGHTLPRGDWNTMHAHVHVGVDMAKPGADHTVHWWG